MLNKFLPISILLIFITSFFLAKFSILTAGLIAFLALFIFALFYFKQALLLFAFFLPFEKTFSFDFSGITLRFSHLLFLAIFFSWIIRNLTNKNWKIYFDRSFIFLILYLVLAAFSMGWAQNFNRGLQVLGFSAFAFLVFLVLYQIFLQEPKYLKLFLKTLFVSTIVVCLFGLFQFFGDLIGLPLFLTGIGEGYTKAVLGFPRVRSTFFEPLYFGNFIILIFPLIYWQTTLRKPILSRKLTKLLLLLLVLNLILTIARSAYLAFLLELVLISIFSLKYFLRPLSLRLLSVFLILISSFLFSLINFPKIYPYKVQEVIKHSTTINDWSSRERLTSGAIASKAFLKNPIKGLGIGQFGPYFDHYPSQMPKTGWQTVNNEPLELLAENGFLALLLILLFYLYLLFRQVVAFFRAEDEMNKKLALSFFVALIGLALQWQFFSTLYIIYIFAFFALSLSFAKLKKI